MTAIAPSRPQPASETTRAFLHALALVGALAAVLAVRFIAVRAGLDPLVAGLGFGLALAAVAGIGWRLAGAASEGFAQGRDPFVRASAIGVGFGVALIAITTIAPALAREPSVPGLGRPAAPFLPWAAVTMVVAIAQEALLRGALFDRIDRLAGPSLAILATAALFALMHVPLYGWHVVPLDLAVGIGLGGLRLGTGRVAAPASAHAVADLATWWM